MAMSRPDGLPLHEGAFDYSQQDIPTFVGETGGAHVTLAAFDHVDKDFAFDPLSTNRRFPNQADLPVLGTVVVAGPTPESIYCASVGAVKQLQLLFDDLPVPSRQPSLPLKGSLLNTLRAAVDNCDASSDDCMMLISPLEDSHTATLLVGSSLSISSVDDATPTISAARRLTPADRSLRFLEAGALGASQPHHVPSRPAVPDLCIASSRLLSCIDPLPLDRLARHTAAAIRAWPSTNRTQIRAVAHRDLRVTRQNIAELQLYMDDHAAHLANCAGAEDSDVPLMSAETFPRLDGGIQAALEEVDQK